MEIARTGPWASLANLSPFGHRAIRREPGRPREPRLIDFVLQINETAVLFATDEKNGNGVWAACTFCYS